MIVVFRKKKYGDVNFLIDQFEHELSKIALDQFKVINISYKNIYQYSKILIYILLFFPLVKKWVCFDFQVLALLKIFNFKKEILFYDIENPYHKIYYNKLSRVIICLARRKCSSPAMVVGCDPFRAKLIRRYYKLNFSSYLPNIRMNSINNNYENYEKTKKNKNVIGYFGRITDLTFANILFKSTCDGKYQRCFVGPISNDHISANTKKYMKSFKETYFDEFEKAFEKINSEADVLVAVTKIKKSDPGTKYQTPVKVWEYLKMNKPIITSYSPSLDFYFRKNRNIFTLTNTNNLEEFYGLVEKSMAHKVSKKSNQDTLKNGIELYNQNMRYIISFLME